MSESLLSRRIQLSSIREPSLGSTQTQVDGLVTRFVDEAADLKTLASLTAGGLAYRYGRIGAMALGTGHVAAMPLRLLSLGVGLGAEVTAFEFTNRTLTTVGANLVFAHPSGRSQGSPLQDPSSNLWSWSGPGGWKQALINDALSFGLLKGAGYLSRESNIVFQHAFSSTAMVAGHQSAALLGIAPKQEGSLAEQLLHAEATNLQLGAGTSLVHTMAPGISAVERGLDLSLQSQVGATHASPLRMGPRWALVEVIRGAAPAPQSKDLQKISNWILMAENDGSDPDATYVGPLPERPSEEAQNKPETLMSLAEKLGVALSGKETEPQIIKAFKPVVMNLISRSEVSTALSSGDLAMLRQLVVGRRLGASEIQPPLEVLEKIVREKKLALPKPNLSLAPAPQALAPAQPVRVTLISDEPEHSPDTAESRILHQKGLEELFQNQKVVTFHPDGRVQVTLRGKRGIGRQDLLDFYRLVFYQAKEFRGFMERLQEQGHDIQSLAPHVQRIDELLRPVMNDILMNEGRRSRPALEQVDAEIDAFQREMLAISQRVPVALPRLGDMHPLFEPGPLPEARPRPLPPAADPARPQRNPTLGLVEDELTPVPAPLPHSPIDKGVIQEAYQAIARVQTPEAFLRYLKEALNKSKQFGLSPYRKEIEGAFKDYLPAEHPPNFQLGQVLTNDNILAAAEKLLSLLANSQRLSPQASEVLSHLVLGLASASERGRRLIPLLATFHPEISPDQLRPILGALRELYQEGVNEILAPFGEANRKDLEEQKALLDKQAKAMMEKP